MSLVRQLLTSAVDCHKAGRLVDAERLYRQVLSIDPRQPDALYLLGLIVQEYDRAAARDLLVRAVQAQPKFKTALNALGVVEQRAGNLDVALRHFSKAIALDPTFVPALLNSGAACIELRRFDTAKKHYRRVAELDPRNGDAWMGLARAATGLKEFSSAEEAFARAIEIRPTDLAIREEFSAHLLEHGKVVDAIRQLSIVIERRPAKVDARCRRARALNMDGQFEAALSDADCALNTDARSSLGWFERGYALQNLRELSEAIVCYRRSAELDPEFSWPQQNLGVLLMAIGQIEQALSVLREAHKRFPQDREIIGALLLAAISDPTLSGDQLLAETVRATAALSSVPSFTKYDNPRHEQRTLRIGYVSGDFRVHSCAFFSLPLIAHHDRSRYEVVCYSTVDQPDHITAQFRACATLWRDISRASDEEAARLIRADCVDILVDMMGWTKGARPDLFRRRPAPVQLTWLGYPGPTGIAGLDWRLGDSVADPPTIADRHFTEKLIRLDRPFLTYAPPADAPGVANRPLHEQVRFASFNNLSKTSPPVVQVWSRILHRVPTATLLLKSAATHDADVSANVRRLFESNCIDPDRISFAAWTSNPVDHLSQYGQIDIALDTFPYNGTTTTLEALWMGVPVITLQGKRHAGRVGLDILSSINCKELAANDEDDYVSIASALAQDAKRIESYRRTLRAKVASSMLTDHAGFARAIESVYRTLWQNWCKTVNPAA